MPSKPETKFENKVVKELDKLPHTWHLKAQMVARVGIPDRLICCNGTFVAWELKTDTGKVSKLQAHNLDLIDKAGGVARVVTPANFELYLEELKSIAGVFNERFF